MARRPVAAVLDDPDLIVVCDDGTVWSYLRGTNEWHRLAAIPGSPAMKKEKDRKKAKGEDRERENAKKAKATAEIL